MDTKAEIIDVGLDVQEFGVEEAINNISALRERTPQPYLDRHGAGSGTCRQFLPYLSKQRNNKNRH